MGHHCCCYCCCYYCFSVADIVYDVLAERTGPAGICDGPASAYTPVHLILALRVELRRDA